jgi:hypothetical protein
MRAIICTLVVLGSTLLFIGCTNQVKRPIECKAYLKTVQEDWTYDSEKEIYAIHAQGGRKNMDVVRNLVSIKKECWQGLSAKRVKKIFGEPSRTKGNAWEYFIEQSCWESNTENCQDFYLIVDPEKGLLSVDLRSFSIVD